jgi:glycosyltransferase involved in cell wall biosynthesis
MKKAIIIPVYLRFDQPEEVPLLVGLEFAKRAIKSLRILKDQNFTLILPVCFDPVGKKRENALPEMDKLLRQEIKGLRKGSTVLFSSLQLQKLREYLDRKNFGNISPLIDLKGYSKIRNTSLLLAQALSMDVAVFIDNDEVVEDPNYLDIARQFLNKPWNGKTVNGKGGFYLNRDGTIFLPCQHLWWRFLWNKTKWMNQVWGKILSSPHSLLPSSILLGGNLVLHRSLFQSVPFDPYIPRGEDTDYLINASHLGFRVLFDKRLRIRHLHPERTGAFFQEELRGDIERFLYEREKTRVGSTIDLDPYPGYFLKWTLYPKALFTSMFLSLDYLAKGNGKKAKECISNLNLFFKKRSEVWSRYLRFKADWERVMGKLPEEEVNEILKECWV